MHIFSHSMAEIITERTMNREAASIMNPELEAFLINNEKTSSLAYGFTKSEIIDEAKTLVYLGVPLIVYYLMEFLQRLFGSMFVGHVGALSLSSASMANAAASITGSDVLIGLAGALETFCGQSFGVNDYELVDVHMQRGILTLALVCIPITVLWANLGKILLWLGQDIALSTASGTYARFMTPGIFGWAVLLCLIVLFRSQRKVMPLMITSIITMVGNIIWCWLLVFKSGLLGNGAAVALDISYWFNAILLMAWMKISPNYKTMKLGLSWEAFYGMSDFLRLGIPSAAMFCLEAWFLEIIVVLSGMLPNSVFETSALSICWNINGLTLMVTTGVCGAITTRVSNELGAGNVKAARLAVLVAVFMLSVISLLIVLIIVFCRHFLVSLFTTEAELSTYAAEMLLFVAASHFFSAIGVVLFGFYKGSGCQKIGAFVNLFAYYVIGIPCSVIFAFVLQLGGKGLWIGMIMARICQVIGLAVIAISIDWQEQGKRLRRKVLINTVQPDEVL